MRRERRPRLGRILPRHVLAACLALTFLPSALSPRTLAPRTAAADEETKPPPPSPPHATLRGFQPTGKYVFQAQDGKGQGDAAPKNGSVADPNGDTKPGAKKDANPDGQPSATPDVPVDPDKKPESSPDVKPDAKPEQDAKPDDAAPVEPNASPGDDPKPAAPPRKTAPNGGPWVDAPKELGGETKTDAKPAAAKPAAEKPAAGEAGATGDAAPAGVYFSRRAASYLVLGSALGHPFLVRTGMNAVESLPTEALVTRDDGSIDLRADVKLTPLGRFTLAGSDVVISVPGISGRLTPPPPILGWHTAVDLLAHTPEYGRDAKAWRVDEACLNSLRTCSTTDIKVAVYFGTWCSSCSLLLGRVLRLDQEVNKQVPADGKPVIRFGYYGLPPPPATWSEPEAVLRKLDHLPTALVFVNGVYCTRIGAADLGRPDVALRAALVGR